MWLAAIAAVVLLVAITAAIKAWDHYTTAIEQRGYDRGEASAKTKYEQRDNKALQEAIAETNALQVKFNAARKQNEALGTANAAAYRQGVKDGQIKVAALLADVKSGKLILRDPGKAVAPVPGVGEAVAGQGGIAASGPGAAGGGKDGLSESASQFLLWIGGEANRLRDKTNALIKQVRADRVQINGAWTEQGHPVLRLDLAWFSAAPQK